MRSNTLSGKTIRRIKETIEVLSRWAERFTDRLMLGLNGRQWLASLLIGLLLLPVFSLPVQATIVVANDVNANSGDFEPVNPPPYIWETAWTKLTVAVEEWTTLRREGNKITEDKSKTGSLEKPKTEKSAGENAVAAENPPSANPATEIKNPDKGNKAEKEAIAEVSENEEKPSAAVTENEPSVMPSAPAAVSKKSLLMPMPTPRPILDESQLPQLISPQNNLGSPMGQNEASSTYPALATITREKAGIGNFGFDVPVAFLPGRGMDASVGLSYNSQLWTKTTDTEEGTGTTVTYNVDGNDLAPGFQMGYGYLDSYGSGYLTNQLILTELNGTRRQLKFSNSRYQTNDGSFIDATLNGTTALVSYTDGTKVTYGPVNFQRRRYPTKITDRHGNYISIAYTTASSGKLSTITDTLGREIKFHYDTTTEKLIAVTVPGFEGGTTRRQTIRFYYETMPLQYTGRFSSADYIEAPSIVSVLKYVYFPGTKTGFRYDYSQHYGMINKINRLEGMQIIGGESLTQMGAVTTTPGSFLEAATTCYNYQDSPCSPGNYLPTGDIPKYNLRIDDWVGRTGSVLQTQYSLTRNVDANGVGTSTMSVLMPDGTKNVSISNVRPPSSSGVIDWEDGLTTETYLSGLGRTAANPWTRTVLKWQTGNTTVGRRDARIEKIETTNEAGQTKATVFGYDNYNNQTLITEHDFAAPNVVGTELTRTEITFETNSQWTSFNRLVRLPLSIKKKVGGAYVSRTDYKYDEQTLADTPNVVQYDGSYNVSSSGYECNCQWVCSTNRDEYGYCPGTEEYICYDTCYTYNPQTAWRGNVTKVIAFQNPAAADETADSGAVVNTFKYDITGNTIEASLNCCNIKTWEYDAANRYAYPTKETKGAGATLTTKAEYNFPTGLTTKTIDENNQNTIYEYETDTLRRKKVTYPNGGYTQTEYSDKLIGNAAQLVPGFVLMKTTLDANKTAQSYSYFDARGLPIRSATLTPDNWSVSAMEYDNIGRPKKSYNPFYVGAANGGIPQNTKFTEVLNYDGLGRTTAVKLQDDTTVATAYNGTVITVTDQAGKQRRQTTDALGRVARVDEPDANGNLDANGVPAQPTVYEYDGNDNLTRITQTGDGATQERFFRYDALSRLTHERQVEATATLNDGGVKVASGGLWTKVLKYDTHSLLTDGYDARGVNTHFAYDGINRVQTVTFSDGTPTVTYTYDQARTGFFNKGALTRVETAEGNAATRPDTPATATELDYDLMGRVKQQRQSIGTQTYNLAYNYNLAGQLTSETYPSGKIVSTNYDANGRLAGISDQSRIYLSSVGYLGNGNNVNGLVLGNGTAQGFAYNDRLQLQTQTLTKPNEILQQYDYGYGQIDANGNLDTTKNNGQLAKVESYIGNQNQWTQKFAYDSLGRLSEAKEYKGATTTLSYQQKFDYDRFGNLYRKATANPTAGQESPLPYTPIENGDISKSTNRFTSNTTYDEAGNVVQDTKFRNLKFAYDANGRMIKTSNTDNTNQANSIYDASGQRVATRVYDEWKYFIYDISSKMVAEYGGTPSTDEGGVKYVLQDWQGSTRAIIGNSGYVQARQDFTAFGEQIAGNVGLRASQSSFNASNNLNQKYGLTERDQASGLDHTWWRKLENQAGRWTSPDPYNGSISLGNPQSFNRYSYVNNQPTNFVDPSGLIQTCYLKSYRVTTESINGEPPTSSIETEWVCTDSASGSSGGGYGGTYRGGGRGGDGRTSGDLDRFGTSNDCEDLKRDLSQLKHSIGVRSRELSYLKRIGETIDSEHTGRLSGERKALDRVERKYKNNKCDGGGDDPAPVPVPVPVPAPAPTPSKESMQRRQNWELGPGATVFGAVGTGVIVYVVGKKLLGVGLLFTPVAPVGVVLIATP